MYTSYVGVTRFGMAQCRTASSNWSRPSKFVSFLLIDALFPIAGTMITLLCYKITIIRIKRIQMSLSWQRDLNVGKLLVYPATIFIIFLPSMVYYFLKFCLGIETVFWDAATLLITHSLGFINALTYGYQSKVYRQPRPPSDVHVEFRRGGLESGLETTEDPTRG